MTKALFKKQMMEVFSWIYKDRKTGKNRSSKGIIGYAVFNLLIFIFLGGIFYSVSNMLCTPLFKADIGWMYFAIMGLIAVAMGVFGSVFNTFSSLYQAKDNDLLLSMPIPPSRILTVRLFGVFTMGLMYELIVIIPAIIVFFKNAHANLLGIIFTLVIPIILSLFVLTLSCILGWVVALVNSRLKNKSMITVIISLAFIAAYYYLYSQAYNMLQKILANPQEIGNRIKVVLYPLYHMGLAAQGNILSMLIFTLIIVALFAAVYLILSKSFLKLATANRSTSKAKYKQKSLKAVSKEQALLLKELRRFTGSPTYMLNCGLGTVFMPVAAVAFLVKGNYLNELMLELFGDERDIAVLISLAAICMIATMNDITAASVSLEGKNLWILKAYPISAAQVLKAKVKLSLLLTLPPALILTVCAQIALKPNLPMIIIMPIIVIAFVLLLSLAGLALNLKMPNLNWTNETIPVKQGLPVMLTLFGGWLFVFALGVIYFVLSKFVSPLVFMLCVSVLLILMSALMIMWLKKKGTKILESL